MVWVVPTARADFQPISTNPTLWFIGAFGAVLLGAGIFLVHRQVERRIDQIGKLQAWSFYPALRGIILLAVLVLFVGIALDAAYRK
jgi:hypothetical protein